LTANKLITKVKITAKVNRFLRFKYQALLDSENILPSIKLAAKNSTM
jgi:hypothetical protein